MVYANDSKSFVRKGVWVQVPPPAQIERSESGAGEGSACALLAWDLKGGAMFRQQPKPRAGVAKIPVRRDRNYL